MQLDLTRYPDRESCAPLKLNDAEERPSAERREPRAQIAVQP